MRNPLVNRPAVRSPQTIAPSAPFPTRRKPAAALEDARAVAARHGWHPVDFLIFVASRGEMPNPCVSCGETHMQPISGGCQAHSTAHPVDAKMRMEAAKEVLPYVASKLQAIEITGKDGGPVATAHATLDLTAILKDPAMLAAAQQIALALSDREPESGPVIDVPRAA